MTTAATIPDLNLGAVVKTLADHAKSVEERQKELQALRTQLSDCHAELSEAIFDLSNMYEEVPEFVAGPEAHQTLVAIAEQCKGTDLQGLVDAQEALTAADRGLSSLLEAVAAAHAEFTNMQQEYAGARVTDATRFHTEA